MYIVMFERTNNLINTLLNTSLLLIIKNWNNDFLLNLNAEKRGRFW